MATDQATTAGALLDGSGALEAFIGALRGRVVRPEDDDYEEERKVQNGLIDRRPAMIAQCMGTADVVEAVNFAREHDLLTSIRGGGHNVAGNAVCDGGIVIDLSRMRGVHVDAKARTVRVQGGATLGDMDRETELFGLATPGGVVSTTGVGGLTLHGGLGHLRRKYGLSIDNLISVEIVTADGQVRTASAEEHPDLFWAVRGAGSNFGVVTSFEFRLHPVGPEVYMAAPVYALEDAPRVVRAWREFVSEAPDEISSIVVFWSVPPVPGFFPDELHRKPVVILAAVHCGTPDEGERALQPLRDLAVPTPVLDLSCKEPFTTVQAGFDPFFPKGLLCYWKALYANELTDEVIDELCRHAAERPSYMSTVEIWHNGGAIARVADSETPFGHRRAEYMISFDASWTDPADNERNIAWSRGAWSAMQRHSTGGLYLNFAGFGEEKDALLRAAYGAKNYERLVTIKERYDPTNLFRVNQNIAPRNQGI